MNKRIVTILMGVLCAATMRGQSSSDTPSLPQLATPSPKATMIDRFGYYPTNLYTGLVDITIPIHTIEVKGIRIPIEFKYHASGLKYDDLPMEVGYGWTLMAGGSVSYSARGTGISKPVGTELSPFIGNPASMANDDLERVEYLWGYKGQRPIAEIKNGSFSALGQAFIDRVTKANSPTSADMSAIEALRTNTAFANSLITTFYYDSDLQPLRITAPNGAKSSLEYDAFGRLMCVKDQNGKIVEAYQYDYKQ